MKSTHLSHLNSERAQLIIDTFYKQGVRFFCLAPGSRSTPLAIAIAEHPEIESTVHFDERGLGFYALGIAKSTKSPVVILVTTGTAVANLFPAVMEAHLSRIPLIILSADRPPELRDCGANQTADHVKFFGSLVRWDVDFAFSDPLSSTEYLTSTVSYAVACSRKNPPGPVQVNCMIREPFISLLEQKPISSSSCVYEPSYSIPDHSSFILWAELLASKKKGILILGSDAIESEDLPSFLLFAEKLRWPIFSDIISGGRSIGNHPLHIEYFELILKSNPELTVETILQIGNRFVSKPLQQWIDRQKDLVYLLVVNHPFRQDPLHKVSRKMECATSFFCTTLFSRIEENKDSWASFWKQQSLEIKDELKNSFQTMASFSELTLFQSLSSYTTFLPFYLSSSMPIRNADLLFFPEAGSPLLFCNRGASGIDGNIATAAGLSKGLRKPLVAILGDLASLHDLNSFALASKSLTPILFIVINNQGGGIFSFLPVAEKKEIFEPFIAVAHNYAFESIAQMFSLKYKQVESLEEWDIGWEETSKSPVSCLIECKTSRHSNVNDHQKLIEKVRSRLSFSQKLLEV